ncbi:ribonuclease P protein subunit p30-like, partial [Saccostrea cucullata]|uniref:ribonuclease P protein subunit p30-like n=1 Tax=Saccostrea cuccullata TaxID=36930 RepID=UPI002ED220E8
ILLLQVDTKRVKILSRVTLNVSDSDQLQYLMSPEVQEYDIVAVRPTSAEIFAKAAKYVNLDIIQLEMEKSTKVITPGGLSEAIELRGPHDVANLGLLFGLNETQAKNSVSRSCRSVLLHAEERRALKAAVALSIGDLQDDQKWVKNKLNEINSVETTEESSPKKRKLE